MIWIHRASLGATLLLVVGRVYEGRQPVAWTADQARGCALFAFTVCCFTSVVVRRRTSDATSRWVARTMACLAVYTLDVYGSLAFSAEWFRVLMYATWWSVPATVACWAEATDAAMRPTTRAPSLRQRAALGAWAALMPSGRPLEERAWRRHPLLWTFTAILAALGTFPGLMVSRTMTYDGPWRGWGFHPNLLYTVVAVFALIYLTTGAAALAASCELSPMRSGSDRLRRHWLVRLARAFPIFASLLFLASALGMWPEAVLDALMLPGLVALAVLVVDTSTNATSRRAARAVHREWQRVGKPALLLGVLSFLPLAPQILRPLALAGIAATLFGEIAASQWADPAPGKAGRHDEPATRSTTAAAEADRDAPPGTGADPSTPAPSPPTDPPTTARSPASPPTTTDPPPAPPPAEYEHRLSDGDPRAAPNAAEISRAISVLVNLERSTLNYGVSFEIHPELAPLGALLRRRDGHEPRLSGPELRRIGQLLADTALKLEGTAERRRGANPNEFEFFAALCVVKFRLGSVAGRQRLARRLRVCALLWKAGWLGLSRGDPPRWDYLWDRPMRDLDARFAAAVERVPGLEANLRPPDGADPSGARRKHYDRCMRSAPPRIARALIDHQATL